MILAQAPNLPTNTTTIPSTVSITVYNAIASVPQSMWQAIVAEQNIYLSIAYLTALEHTMPSNITPLYSIEYTNEVPTAVYYSQLYTLTKLQIKELFVQGKYTSYQKIKHNLQQLIVHSICCKPLQILVMGNLLQSGESSISKASNNITHVINTITKQHTVDAIVIKDTTLTLAQIQSTKHIHIPITAEPCMNMEIPTSITNLTDYKALLDKKYRTKYKAAQKLIAHITHKLITRETINANESTLYNLWLQVYNQSNFKAIKIEQNFFSNMLKAMPQQYYIQAYYNQSEIISFASYYISGTTCEVQFVGMNYELLRPLKLYQNMLYNFIDLALQHKCTLLKLGRTATEIKSTVGAKPFYYNNYISIKSSLVNKIALPYINKFAKKEYTIRNPYKDV